MSAEIKVADYLYFEDGANEKLQENGKEEFRERPGEKAG